MKKTIITILAALAVMVLAIGLGSVSVAPPDIWRIIMHKAFGREAGADIPGSMIAIIWDIRMPRACVAFITGAMLSVSGAIMQSLLQNPLASSYTLGVSSGASLGAAIVIVSGVTLPLLSVFTLPFAGFVSGLVTVLIVLAFSSKLDGNLRSHTVILFGMIISLFTNAILTMISAAASEHMQRLILWQLGSFAGRRWDHVGILLTICITGIFAAVLFHRELDLMSFGEEASMAAGVEIKKTRLILLLIASVLTGASVCFTGVIGFIDLAAPHAVRRIFGSAHKKVLPMSAVAGGSFMVLADLLARTLMSPQEIPVGAVSAMFGAPFFLWIYFGTKKER